MSDYTQSNLTELQHNLLLSTLFLLALHIIVSFVMICVSLYCKKTRIVTSAWVVSLIVTIASFVLVLLSFIEKPQNPCPIQISEPFIEDKIFGNKTRKDIEKTINEVNKLIPDLNNDLQNATGPNGDSLKKIVLPPLPAYSANRKYLVMTRHYLKSINMSVAHIIGAICATSGQCPDTKTVQTYLANHSEVRDLINDLESANVVPIGYIEGGKIFGIFGSQWIPPQLPPVWMPTPGPTTVAPSPAPTSEKFTYI